MSIDYKYVEYLAYLDDNDESQWVVVPVRWVDDLKKLKLKHEENAWHMGDGNAPMRLLSCLDDANEDVSHVFDKGSVDRSRIDDVFFSANTLYTLMDEGYINKKCVEAFQAKEGAE